MTETRYDTLAAALPVPILERRAVCSPLADCTGGETSAVYVAVTAHGYACYVGQARRGADATGAAARRLCDHRREPSKTAEWAGHWVLPLPDDTPRGLLDASERVVAGILGLPVRNRRWRLAQQALYR